MLNNENKTKYKIEYEVSKKPEIKKSSIKRILSGVFNLFRNEREKQAITYSYIYDGSLPVEKLELAVDMGDAKLGWYDLVVTIKDLNGGVTTSKSTEFGISDSYVYYVF